MTTNWRENALHFTKVGRCIENIELALRGVHAQGIRNHNEVANALAEAVMASRQLTRALESIRDTANSDRRELNSRQEAATRRAEPK